MEYLTIRAAAEMLGISRQAVWSLISRGHLPAIRPSRRLLLIPRRAVIKRKRERAAADRESEQ